MFLTRMQELHTADDHSFRPSLFVSAQIRLLRYHHCRVPTGQSAAELLAKLAALKQKAASLADAAAATKQPGEPASCQICIVSDNVLHLPGAAVAMLPLGLSFSPELGALVLAIPWSFALPCMAATC
jgi:hypothetical protein